MALWALINSRIVWVSSQFWRKIINSMQAHHLSKCRQFIFYIIFWRSMWFIARKTCHKSCVCRCDIFLGFFLLEKVKIAIEEKGIQWVHTKLTVCASQPDKEMSFLFSYLFVFNDNEIYCIPLFIATQTKDHKCVIRESVCQYLLWNIAIHNFHRGCFLFHLRIISACMWPKVHHLSDFRLLHT